MTEQEKKDLEYLEIYLEGTVNKIRSIVDEAKDIMAQAERVIAGFRRTPDVKNKEP